MTKYRYDQEIEVLQIVDHDPSGAHLFLALAEDVQAFAEALDLRVSFTRLAVTPEQIEALALPIKPPKATDRRAFDGETCQAEAIPPDTLVSIVQDAIDERLDREAFDDLIEREFGIREELERRLP